MILTTKNNKDNRPSQKQETAFKQPMLLIPSYNKAIETNILMFDIQNYAHTSKFTLVNLNHNKALSQTKGLKNQEYSIKCI